MALNGRPRAVELSGSGRSSSKPEAAWMTDEAAIFRDTVRKFIEKELVPNQERWAAQGRPDADVWHKAGDMGLLAPEVPEAYGGSGGTFAHEAVIIEELGRAAINFGFGNHSIVARYILAYGNEEQKRSWLPRMARGELVGAIAMTEPDCGSDLKAIKTTAAREGEHYVINGAKTFITNGSSANFICLAVRTDGQTSGLPSAGMKGLSLLIFETTDLSGYATGNPFHKVGRHAVDVCNLFFDRARVPASSLLGPGEGRGFLQMMEQLTYERLAVGLSALAAIERAIELTTRYVKDRKAFERPLLDFQNTRFKLAECKTAAHIGRVFIDDCIQKFIDGRLNAVIAAMAKYWLTESQCRIVDECLQLHGGYGYVQESAIARMWVDGRVQRIYAGSNEIMKEVVGSSL
jgi:acyl-CoA dehydrogenase